jgi:MutS domain V
VVRPAPIDGQSTDLGVASPAAEYTRRLELWKARAQHLEPYERHMGTVRLLLAALIIAVAWASLASRVFSAIWILPAIAAFVAAVLWHGELRRRWTRARRALALYRNGLARLQGRWAGSGPSGERLAAEAHVYAADLDLFGRGSLFELVSAARTRMGEDTLAQWLLAPGATGEIRERQACVAELRDRVDLAEDLALLGEEGRIAAQPRALVEWAESPSALSQPWIRVAAWTLPALFVVTAVLWGTLGLASPFLLIVLIEIGVLTRLRPRLAAALRATEAALQDLETVAELLSRVERESFQTPAMQALIHTLSSQGQSACRSLGKLDGVANLVESSRRNQLVRWFLNVPLLFPLQTALLAERWRCRHGAVVRIWVEATGRVEALGSFARYSYEHPSYPFPELLAGPPRFNSAALGHPLLPADRCIRNEVELGGDTPVLLVSGSNMSGKSTLLRAVGLNAVLAMAGAPVCARHLSLTPLQVAASIRINDSLQEGSSRFYAEITRLRQIYELAAREPPVLFLLDEVLQGTNSHDRRIGAEALLRAYRERGAIGLATTHDLALTALPGLEEGLRNVHFDDHIDNGAVTFDYRLHDGVVTKSNALELMRSIGLKV